MVSRLTRLRLGEDRHWSSSGDQSIHACGTNADSLLTTAHLQAVELRSIKESTEDVLDLLANNARSVVDHRHAVARTLGSCRPRWLKILDDHRYLRQDLCFFAGIKRVVHRLLDGGEHRLARVVEPQQMAVLGEEFTD